MIDIKIKHFYMQIHLDTFIHNIQHVYSMITAQLFHPSNFPNVLLLPRRGKMDVFGRNGILVLQVLFYLQRCPCFLTECEL